MCMHIGYRCSAAPPALIDASPGERRPVRSREACFKTRPHWGSIGTLILGRLLGQETPPPAAPRSMQRSDTENGGGSVLLHRLWISGEVYEPLYNARRQPKSRAA